MQIEDRREVTFRYAVPVQAGLCGRVIALMDYAAKSGAAKPVSACSLLLTGKGVVAIYCGVHPRGWALVRQSPPST